MAEYKIECEQFLGISHSGGVYTNGESTVELTDEEVTTLLQLIRQKGTTDVDKIDLETTHPQLYAKLDKGTGFGKAMITDIMSMMMTN